MIIFTITKSNYMETTTTEVKESLRQLPQEVKKNGLMHTLVKRGNKAVIYRVTDPENGNLFQSYEVARIKITPAKMVFNVPYPDTEKFPGNEDFGAWAWCFGSSGQTEAEVLARATARFNGIEDGTYTNDGGDTDGE